MSEILQEYCDSRAVAVRVEREAGVIRGVKILGLKSRNGRTYLPEALAQAAPLYEEAKVNVNHPKGGSAGPRDYRDRIGVMRQVVLREGEGLFADFHFNPKHALAEQLLWDAEHAPENVGFSHNVEARTARRGDGVVVEAITRVESVDLVADPATTRGLFESSTAGDGAATATAAGHRLSADELKRDYPELVAELGREQAAEIDRLRKEMDRLTAQEALQQKQAMVRRLLRESHLPDLEAGDPRANAIVGPRFLESLMAAPSEQAMRELIEERANLVRSLGGSEAAQRCGDGRPLSRDQHLAAGAGRMDAKSFARAIT